MILDMFEFTFIIYNNTFINEQYLRTVSFLNSNMYFHEEERLP